MVRGLKMMLLVAASPTALLAYTDPGTGMLVWQSVTAIVVGLLFSTRRVLARMFKRQQ